MEQIRDVEHLLDSFRTEYVLNQEEEEGGVAWRHRPAPFRRIEAAVQLHAPRCGDAGRLGALRLGWAIRSLGAEGKRRGG
eukprot:6307525-Alexandrium_andersonii.AAC.1